jgi:hypothetical protein
MVTEAKTFEEKVVRADRTLLSIAGLIFTLLTIVELCVAKVFIIYKIVQILSGKP